MLLNLHSGLLATSQSYGFAGKFMAADQARMGLANTVRPDMTPAQIASVHQQDKALELQSVHSKVMFEAAQAMEDAARQRQKKEAERKQQAIANGVLFG